MKEIVNVISNEELKDRFDKLCKDNWKIRNMTSNSLWDTKEILDNWPKQTRLSLLKMLNLSEDSEYNGVYHPITIKQVQS